MSTELPSDFVDEVLSTYPLPIADSVVALEASDSHHQRRDRVVEVFRTTLRYLSAIALSSRIQFGSGAGDDDPHVVHLLRTLRQRGLTDGQWVGLTREILRPWRSSANAHPFPELVTLFHTPRSAFSRALDGLLGMRKSETVAHGATGEIDELEVVLQRRVPELRTLLEALRPMLQRAQLAIPLSRPDDTEAVQRAWRLGGCTPPRGRWRRRDLAAGVRLSPTAPVLIDADGRPILALAPVCLIRRPAPEVVEELFVLDGSGRRGARYVALPSMAEHYEAEVWKELEAALLGGNDRTEATEPGATSPYRGLEPFGAEHAELFYGREGQTEALANRIRRHAMVTVTGPSGSGKTSLLQAGVLPQLSNTVVVSVRPGAHPIDQLARRLAEALGNDLTLGSAHGLLGTRPVELAAGLYRWARDHTATLLIVVDQGEELFTLCDDPVRREAFAAALAAIADDDGGPLRVLLSVREDFFARLATLAPILNRYARHVEVVTTPDRAELARTLVMPLKRFGFTFENAALVDEMVDAVAGEPAALALLQFCADRLWDARDRSWKRLTRDAYEALGGVEGAVAAHADRVLANLTEGQRRAARELLLRLVTRERTRAVVSTEEILSAATDRVDADVVLQRLIDARLMTTHEGNISDEPARIELVHEALIHHWGQLRTWLDENSEGQRFLQTLRGAAHEWDDRGRPEGLLWRDDMLHESRIWRRRGAPQLTPREQDFVNASEAAERLVQKRRQRFMFASIGAALVVAVVLGVSWLIADRARREAEDARRQTEAALLEGEARQLYLEGIQAEADDLDDRAAALLRAAVELERQTEADETGATIANLDRITAQPVLSPVLPMSGMLAWSPDGRLLAVARNRVRVVDTRTGDEIHDFPVAHHTTFHTTETCVAFAADGATLTALSGKVEVSTWNVATGALIARHQLPHDDVQACAISPNGRNLVVGLEDSRSQRWDTRTGDLVAEQTRDGDAVTALAWSPDGAWIASGTHLGTIEVMAVADGSTIYRACGKNDQVNNLRFTPDSDTVISARWDRDICLIHLPGGDRDCHLIIPTERADGVIDSGRAQRVSEAGMSVDGQWLAAAGTDNGVWLLPVDDPAAVIRLSGHRGPPNDVQWSPIDTRLATSSQDGTTRIWTIDDDREGLVIPTEGVNTANVDWSPDSELVATGDAEGGIQLWDVTTGTLRRRLDGGTRPVFDITFTPDGRRLLTTTEQEFVRVWDVASGDLVCEPRVDDDHAHLVFGETSPDGDRVAAVDPWSAAFLWDVDRCDLVAALDQRRPVALGWSYDGELLAIGESPGGISLYDARDGAMVRQLPGTGKFVLSPTFDRATRRLAGGGSVGSDVVRIWDVSSGEVLASMEGHSAVILDISWSPDDRLLASGSMDESAILWDATTGVVLQRLEHGAVVERVVWSNDGSTVATAGYGRWAEVDQTNRALTAVRLWDVDTGGLLREIGGHRGGVVDVAFSPDGSRLLTVPRLDQAHIWPIAWPDPAQLIRDTGAATNLRVCRASFNVVPVLPFPAADSVWAPEELCPVGP